MTETDQGQLVGDGPMVESWWLPDVMGLEIGLRRWVARRFGDGVGIRCCRFPESDLAGMNVSFDLDGRDRRGCDVTGRYVARSAPRHTVFPMLPPVHLGRQKSCTELVTAASKAPVPAIRWHEMNPEWLGAEFVVMSRSAGRPWPSNPPYTCSGWVLDSSAQDRAVMQEAVLAAVAELHRISEERADLTFLDRPRFGAAPLDQHVGFLRWFYDWAREGRSYPIVESAIRWLDRHRPAGTGPMVLNWGDARPGNMLFDGTRVVAVLDWNMAAVGPREVDLGSLVLFHRYFQAHAADAGSAGLPGLFRHGDVVEGYALLAAHQATDLRWFELLAATRIAIQQVRQIGRAVFLGRLPVGEAADDVRIASRRLIEELLDG
ncbi:hypothetical protein BJF78_07060 [Pseudonocardia sp. CNS-139]|nr:hypothetical protein BJF78_07060 [Pseudonocardia sp. CNS-139]